MSEYGYFVDWEKKTTLLRYYFAGETKELRDTFFHGRQVDSNVVHLYRSESRTPWCGSGNTHNVNMRGRKRVLEVEGDITCKRCVQQREKMRGDQIRAESLEGRHAEATGRGD